MLLLADNRWLPLALLASFGVSEVLSACVPPVNLTDGVLFSKVDKSFVLSCADRRLTLVPILSSASALCEDDKLVMSSTLPNGSKVDLTKMKCSSTCLEPGLDLVKWRIASKDNQQLGDEMGQMAHKRDSRLYFIPGVKINLKCTIGYSPSSPTTQCGDDGQWTPPVACSNGVTTTENIVEGDVSLDSSETTIILVSVVVVSVVPFVIIVLVIVLRAKRRGACRKWRAPTSHPEDSNYPNGYTQLGSGPGLPSYADALEEGDNYRDSPAHSDIYSVYRPTTTTADYRQLSYLETSSRGESESLSAGSHRHSLFSGTSSNYRNVVGGDDHSDILLQGDHLSMSDTSTLVTVNTYESSRSLTNSRRGIAGSMVSNTATSMDDAPLIIRRNEQDLTDNRTHNNNVES